MDEIELLIQQVVDASERDGSFPRGGGLAVSVVKVGQPPRFWTRGLRERDRSLPVTENTRFALCSLTKAFTALTTCRLARERGLDLDTPLINSTARFKLADPHRTALLSLRDILAHRAGLPANDLCWYLAPCTEQELSDALACTPGIDGGFRKTFVYGNILYGLLGSAFPELFGVSWDEAIASRIAAPLKLMSVSASADGECALPYAGSARARDIDMSVVAAAGALRGTIVDLAEWLNAWLERRSVVAPPAFFTEALTAQIPAHEVNPLFLNGLSWLDLSEQSYGLGWLLASRGSERVAFHPGFIDGYSPLAVLMPDRGLAIAVLTNVNFTSLPARLAGVLLDSLVDGRTPKNAAPREPMLGRYHHALFGEAAIVESCGAIFFEYRGHRWPWQRSGDGKARIDSTIFGLPIALDVVIDGATLEIPLSLDPRVQPARFEKVMGL